MARCRVSAAAPRHWRNALSRFLLLLMMIVLAFLGLSSRVLVAWTSRCFGKHGGGELRGHVGRIVARRASEGAYMNDPESSEESVSDADWRAFRARLVQGEGGEQQKDGWAHVSPLIETGSLLLSTPSNHFALNQQYFHKTVIFIIEHTPLFTKGIILNRPTAFNTVDLEIFSGRSGLSKDLLKSTDQWNVWCGGDCQGINISPDDPHGIVYTCLHALDKFADQSKTVIKGTYQIELETARQLVASGKADKDDFLLVVGYCGWGQGQLQNELDRGDTWKMAAVDQKIFLGKLRDDQSALTRRLRADGSAEASPIFTAAEVGDGMNEWRELYSMLGPSELAALNSDDMLHSDQMLRHWINRCLIPPRHQPARIVRTGAFANSPPLRSLLQRIIPAGTILRSSATAWLLGKAAERPNIETNFVRGLPGQYFHKAVLLLVQEHMPGSNAKSMLVLLNGPQVGAVEEKKQMTPVFFGGPRPLDGIFSVKSMPYKFHGCVELGADLLSDLLALEALELVESLKAEDVMAVPVEDRWSFAGGQLELVSDAALARQGDIQLHMWYKRFLGLEFPRQI